MKDTTQLFKVQVTIPTDKYRFTVLVVIAQVEVVFQYPGDGNENLENNYTFNYRPVGNSRVCC